MKSPLIALLAVIGHCSAGELQKLPFDLLKSDADLIRHIQHTEHVLSAALGRCSNDKIVRGVEGLPQTFVYTATCAIKPLSDTPCPAYSVMASGTVGGSYAATVQSLTLARLCPGQ